MSAVLIAGIFYINNFIKILMRMERNMDKSNKEMDFEEKKIQQLANEIDSTDNAPDSLAEATTAPLSDDALGGTASQDDLSK